MTDRPILALDTSVFDRLVRGTDPEPIIAAVLTGYAIRIPEMSFGEILSTRNPELRMKLLTVCRRLLGVGICMMPAHWIIDLHVKSFHTDPGNYDWQKVNVRATEIESEIHSGELARDEILVEQQAQELRLLQDQFEDWYKPLPDGTGKLNSFAEWLTFSLAPSGSFWNTARLIYEGAFGQTSAVDQTETLTAPPDEATLRRFLDACPPVRAFIYALELTLYDRSLRAEGRLAYKAGRNDQMMAVYLPYCQQFLTNDGPQQRGLSEVAVVANIPCKVRLYSEFCSSHLIGA